MPFEWCFSRFSHKSCILVFLTRLDGSAGLTTKSRFGRLIKKSSFRTVPSAVPNALQKAFYTTSPLSTSRLPVQNRLRRLVETSASTRSLTPWKGKMWCSPRPERPFSCFFPIQGLTALSCLLYAQPLLRASPIKEGAYLNGAIGWGELEGWNPKGSSD